MKIDPSANHKLKWTIRFASGTLGVKQTATEPVPSKDDALKLGIKKILDFGKGIEYFNPDGSPHKYFHTDRSAQRSNEDFLSEVHQILKENGIT